MHTRRMSSLPRLFQYGLLLLAGAICLAIGPAMTATASDPPPPLQTKASDQATRVFPLLHADAAEVRDVILEIIEPDKVRCSVHQGQNAVILSGPSEVLKTAAELISELDAGAEAAQRSVMAIIALKHAKAEDMAKVINEMFGRELSCVLDEPANSLLLNGGEAAVAKAKQVIAVLDEPPSSKPTPPPQEINVFSLLYAKPDNTLARALEMAIGEHGSFAIDENRKLVILKADPAGFEATKSILERLDTTVVAPPDEPAGLRVRIAWLVSGLEREDAALPPADLKDVLDELARISVTGLRLAAQTVVNVTSGEFTVKATPMLDNRCDLTVVGRIVDPGSAKPRLELELSVLEYSEYRIHGTGSSSRTFKTRELCKLETTVAAPLGHAVVLGVTPIDKMTSVFVIQVMSAEGMK